MKFRFVGGSLHNQHLNPWKFRVIDHDFKLNIERVSVNLKEFYRPINVYTFMDGRATEYWLSELIPQNVNSFAINTMVWISHNDLMKKANISYNGGQSVVKYNPEEK